jgi:hypothetical protein
MTTTVQSPPVNRETDGQPGLIKIKHGHAVASALPGHPVLVFVPGEAYVIPEVVAEDVLRALAFVLGLDVAGSVDPS